ncbi:MAG: S1/P1 nuclease [Allosphingosinicella sp.]
MLKRLLALLALLLLASPASAWWEYGHYSVGRVAMLEVKPSTRAAVQRLMAQSALLETPKCPIRNIEEASYWPDCVKTLGERFSYAYSWHYQNVDICKPFDLKAPCKDGNCVSAQIERNLKLLKDKSVPTRERVMALAFLVHFMGDLHQPLHAGDKSDRGGNDFKADYGAIPSNIHAIWDGLLADRAISSAPPDAAGILSGFTPAEREAMAGGTVEDWSRESWETAREFGYGALMTDPCGPLPTERPQMDEATIERLIPILRRQVARGGIRLARLLDEALG